MGKEIERKFLVTGSLPKSVQSTIIRQGYLQPQKERAVRIRTISGIEATRGILTIKGLGDKSGMSRYEFETEIPLSDAVHLLTLCDQPLIEKARYTIDHQGFTWEIDQFHGANTGLIIAEIELASREQEFSKPDFIGKEVTGQVKYYNTMLQQHPYCEWKDE